jgi:hypothetical protein
MGAVALEQDVELVGAGHDRASRARRTGRRADRASCACRTPRPPGKRSNRPSSIITRAPPSVSSAGWKMNTTVPSKFGWRQVFCRPQQHGGVTVVAAGVHAAIVAGTVGKQVLLQQRQGIHVGAQGDGAATGAVAQDADHAGSRQAAMGLDTQPGLPGRRPP